MKGRLAGVPEGVSGDEFSPEHVPGGAGVGPGPQAGRKQDCGKRRGPELKRQEAGLGSSSLTQTPRTETVSQV